MWHYRHYGIFITFCSNQSVIVPKMPHTIRRLMSDNRFILQPYKGRTTRYECPSCHRSRCFTRYIDTEGKISFPDTVGRCDHENNCGYHYTPKQYFHDNPEAKRLLFDNGQNAKVPIVPHIEKPKADPYFFNPYLMTRTERDYSHNHLALFLAKLFGMNRIADQMKLFHAGTTKSGAVAYWQVDIEGRIRDCKVMVYDAETGHRSKDPQQHVNWLHSLMKIDKACIQQCFFGEHLISMVENKDKPIAIVESEKTAIIASMFMPQFIWIATGGKDGMFSRADYNVLKGHKVILFPDLGMLDNWHQKSIALIRHGIDANVYDYLERNATDEDKVAGLDIADFLLRQMPNLKVPSAKADEGVMPSPSPKSPLSSNKKGGNEESYTKEHRRITEERWHGHNPTCHKCDFSHEGINGTYCNQLKRYVEYGKGDCGK